MQSVVVQLVARIVETDSAETMSEEWSISSKWQCPVCPGMPSPTEEVKFAEWKACRVRQIDVLHATLDYAVRAIKTASGVELLEINQVTGPDVVPGVV